jgi:serine-type D-Ala-D-Ala carboxypeptidase/endopeptidase (penicillin-binding protein 4)
MGPVVLLAAVLAATAPTPAQKQRDREALKAAITQVIERSPLKTARISVQVRSLDDGSVVFARNADELLNPASNVKLFTAAAALSRLGTEYRFDTEFLTDSDYKDGKTRNFYVRGKGDPTVTTERLYGIVSDVLHAGLKEITGDIVLDESWFDAERNAPGYDQEVGDRAYLAPTGAISLNWNSVGIYLRPGHTPGAAASAEIEPMSDFFVLESQLGTGSDTQRRFNVLSELDKDRIRQKLVVNGFVPFNKGVWSVWKKVDQPGLYFGFTLKKLLLDRGVKFKGRVRLDKAPGNARMLHVAQSDTLDIVLKKLQKHSNNFVAETLIKTLGAEVKGAPGSTARGIEVVEDFLEQDVGIRRGTFVMKNGSGLNDTNRFSASQLTRLLQVMWEKFPTAPEYMSALGIAGKDGTLKFRFEGTEATGRLRAKTGTLENVSALAGYLQAVSGEKFVFAVEVNDFPGRASTVVQHIDAIGATVAAMGSEKGPGSVLAQLQPPSVVGPMDVLKARLGTYSAMAQKPDKRNVPFLRTTWRAEKDPAVRAVIAWALYESDPTEGASARLLTESYAASEEVYGRVRRAAREAGAEVPGITSLVSLAAAGNQDALARLFELSRAAPSGPDYDGVALGLTQVANEASYELLFALARAPEAEREAATTAIANGFVKAAQPDAPFWNALKNAQGSPDLRAVDFARGLEVTLSQKIAEARAPAPDGAAPANAAPQTAPGG